LFRVKAEVCHGVFAGYVWRFGPLDHPGLEEGFYNVVLLVCFGLFFFLG